MLLKNTSGMTNTILTKKNVIVSEKVCSFSLITIEIYGYEYKKA